MKKRVVAASVLACVTATAGAADGFYFGVSAGQATYDFEPLRLAAPIVIPGPIPGGVFEPISGLRPAPVAPPFLYTGPVAGLVAAAPQRVFWVPGRDDEATSWNLLAGYQFSRYLSVELAYHDFGTLHEYSPSRTIGPITTLDVKSEMDSTGATLSLQGALPITDQWSVYLRTGGLFADQEVSRRIGTHHLNESYDSEVFLYGIGTQLDFGAHWTVRLDFQSYDDVGKGNGIGEADVELLSLGVLFRLSAN